MTLSLRITSHPVLTGAIILLTVSVAPSVWMLVRGDGGGANPDDLTQVARGAQVYAEHCARCHDAQLEGRNRG